MRNELFDRKPDPLGSLEEIKGGGVIAQRVYPRTHNGDLLRADVEMRIDRSVAAVDKEAQLAQPAAVANEFIDIAVCNRRTRALEGKIR